MEQENKPCNCELIVARDINGLRKEYIICECEE